MKDETGALSNTPRLETETSMDGSQANIPLYTIAKIAVSAATYAIDRPYDYKVPADSLGRVAAGMRVLVPFGIGNRKVEGVILSLAPESGQKELKSIERLIDDAPILNDDNLGLAIWMSDRFFCTVFDALRSMLPAGMWYKDGARHQGGKTVSTAALNIDNEEAAALINQKRSSAPRQAAIIELLTKTGSMSVKEICSMTGASGSTVKILEKHGVLALDKREFMRRPVVRIIQDIGPIALNERQRAVYDKIFPLLSSGKPEAALLYGVTGSGKTLVYIKLIEDVVARGRSAIVLVPEISLTPQVMSIFASRFGDAAAVLHSALGAGERYDEWRRINSGSVRVVVGTRSAVFAPVENLGLIVIDEEQEHTYKSENSPRYHAREVAKYRVAHSGALLILSSATPSIESMYNAQCGKYKLFRIENRFNEMELPSVYIADMKQELKAGNSGCISSVLRRELEINILSGRQSILFINRRGANPIVTCGECGFIFQCGQCSVSLTYHLTGRRLLCHYCGSSRNLPAACTDCGGKLRFVGAGTQRVEAELKDIFPGVSLIRMDADAVTRINSHADMLSRFRDEKTSILLGTQMITKGLDFENVTLVGVLSADMSLYICDYRAHEKTFSLITQVIGRSGRGAIPGRAVIQTFTPAHEVIKLSSKQDYDGFYKREIQLRRVVGSPPIRDLLTLTATGANEASVVSACQKLRAALDEYFRRSNGVILLGPAPAPISKVKNKYRYRLLLSCENTKRVRETVAHTIREFSRGKQGREVMVYADADAYD